MSRTRIAIVGATSEIAFQCAKIWAKEGSKDFVLIGRNVEKLSVLKADLMARSQDANVEVLTINFLSAEDIKISVANLFKEARVDICLIAHGALSDQFECQDDIDIRRDALMINALSPALIAEEFAKHMENQGSGKIAMIGSVAGDRGRKSNYIYGASKALLDAYSQGMDHRFAANPDINIINIKPGPTKTPMTAGMGEQYNKFAEPADVAQDIVTGISKNKNVIYTPGKWRLIMFIIKNLPRFIFNKMDI